MKKNVDILVVTNDCLATILGSFYSNIPSDVRVLECMYNRDNETIEIKIEHPNLTEVPEGCQIMKISGIPYY